MVAPTPALIEQRIALEVADDGLDRLGAVASAVEHLTSDVEGGVQGRIVFSCDLRIVGLVAHLAGTAVNDNNILSFGHRSLVAFIVSTVAPAACKCKGQCGD